MINSDYDFTGSGYPSVPNGTTLSDYLGVYYTNGTILKYDVQIIDNGDVSTSVPEPATVLFLGLGLVGLAGARRKFQK